MERIKRNKLINDAIKATTRQRTIYPAQPGDFFGGTPDKGAKNPWVKFELDILEGIDYSRDYQATVPERKPR